MDKKKRNPRYFAKSNRIKIDYFQLHISGYVTNKTLPFINTRIHAKIQTKYQDSWCQELVGVFLTSKNYLILIQEKKDK